MTKKITIRKDILNIFILFVYAVVLIVGMINHEFWRDELQAWTIARDLSIIDIFKQMKWEGHPCLWHLILMPFAHLGLPPSAMGIVSAIFMFITAAIILYKTPFDLLVKVFLVFSAPFLYFYSIESRVYCIIPFLLCMLAMAYPKRMEKPFRYTILLAFLTNTHVMMSCFVGIMSLLFFKDIIVSKKYKEKKYWISLGIIFLGIVILFLQVYQSLASNSIVSDLEDRELLYSDNYIINLLLTIVNGFIGEVYSYTGFYLSINQSYIVLAILAILIVLGLIYTRKIILVGVVPYLFIFLIHVFIWFSLPQRSVMLIFLLMFALWIYKCDLKEENHKTKIIFIVEEVILSMFCLLSIYNGLYSYIYDVLNPVSGAKETSSYIEENLSDAEFICPVDYVATSITGYIDRDIFYSNIRDDYFTFVNWDSYWRKEVSFEEFYNNMLKFRKSSSKEVYLIHSEYFLWSYDYYIEFLENNNIIKEIYESPMGLDSESYIIYKFID